MREVYLGDSYDLVKRFWSQGLSNIAPLYAHPRFVPQGIRAKYTHVTGIPVLESTPQDSFGLLLDPDTGIPLPNESIDQPTNSHAPLPFIVHVNEALHPTYMICFDQSYHRIPGLSRQKQRSAKLQFLSKRGLSSFYYVSHAPFLFAASSMDILNTVYVHLVSLGIPECRLECELPGVGRA